MSCGSYLSCNQSLKWIWKCNCSENIKPRHRLSYAFIWLTFSKKKLVQTKKTRNKKTRNMNLVAGSFTVINRLPMLHYLLPTVLQKTAQHTRKLNSIVGKNQLIIEVNFDGTNTIHATALEKIAIIFCGLFCSANQRLGNKSPAT